MTTTANSSIFSTTLFGLGSGVTAEVLVEMDRTAQENYLAQSTSKMGSTVPVVPSNQRIAKDN